MTRSGSSCLWAGTFPYFGVATSFELALHPVGPEVIGGVVFYPGDEAAQVVSGWRDLVGGFPDELSTLVNLTTAPPAPFIPEEWHFRKVAAVIACWAGDAAEGEDAVKPLRVLGTPINDLLGPIPYLGLQSLIDPLWEPGAANYFTSAGSLASSETRFRAGMARSSLMLPSTIAAFWRMKGVFESSASITASEQSMPISVKRSMTRER